MHRIEPCEVRSAKCEVRGARCAVRVVHRAIVVLVAFVLASLVGRGFSLASPPAAQQLTNSAALSRIYDMILDARFDEADQQIRQGCGGAPAIPCDMLTTVNMWWRIQMDPTSTATDAIMRTRMDKSVADADGWTRREPTRAEAWFYLGCAYAVRVQFHAVRGERMAAARDGKRIKDALEHALSLNPSLNDAFFGIGLYHYYADIAPAALKILRFLLLLPGGNKVQGMNEMLQARDRGELLRGEADYQMHLLYLWYENKPDRAMELLRGLHDRFPHNPLFLDRIAEVEDVYFHDYPASLDAGERLVRDARAGKLGVPAIAEVYGRLRVARALDAMAETDRAIEELKPIVDARAAAPYGALARAALALGKAYDRMGQRADAMNAYRIAVNNLPAGDPDEISSAANNALRRAPDVKKAQAYALSLEGWRHFERGNYAQAEMSLQRALAIDQADPVAHYRYGRVLQARDADNERALTEFDVAAHATPPAPAPIVASSYYEAARVLEARGDRARAVQMYENATRVTGASPRTKDAALKSVARLRKINSRGQHRS